MSKTLWITASPTCVGKSYLHNQRKDIVSKLTNIDSFDNIIDVNTTEELTSILSKDDKTFLLHLEISLIEVGSWCRDHKYHPLWNQYLKESKIQKKVLILGLNYSDYIDRLKLRRRLDYHNISKDDIVKIYETFINDLEKLNIEYKLVESKDNYRTLSKTEFFKLIKDE
tara:strand:- start:38 stop:544 length:507 start_codon:yes stop_codon:yes gene_type:complete